MPELFSQRQRSISRAVILFAMLAGLLFSAGEGIRLFPFPAAKINSGKNLQGENAGRLGYEKNLHRFESGQKKQSSFGRQQLPSLHRHFGAYPGGSLNFPVAAVAGISLSSSVGTKFPAPVQSPRSLVRAGSRASRPPPPSFQYFL